MFMSHAVAYISAYVIGDTYLQYAVCIQATHGHMYTCTGVHTHTHTNTHTFIHTHTYTHTHMISHKCYSIDVHTVNKSV